MTSSNDIIIDMLEVLLRHN